MAKLWGGAFDKSTHRDVEIFTASMAIDERLWEVDIAGSIAHAKMLGQTGIISKRDSEKIVEGLQDVASRIGSNELSFDPTAEDVHSEIERFLVDAIGPLAGKLHTARSRNDQVATDTRLYLRGKIVELNHELAATQSWLLESARGETDTVMP
ncbi:MAG: argininosuccinate lyase, partial [Cryobacterium sp.]|nr:argininosuccinate lyase [Oligoflexia bacterium]